MRAPHKGHKPGKENSNRVTRDPPAGLALNRKNQRVTLSQCQPQPQSASEVDGEVDGAARSTAPRGRRRREVDGAARSTAPRGRRRGEVDGAARPTAQPCDDREMFENRCKFDEKLRESVHICETLLTSIVNLSFLWLPMSKSSNFLHFELIFDHFRRHLFRMFLHGEFSSIFSGRSFWRICWHASVFF